MTRAARTAAVVLATGDLGAACKILTRRYACAALTPARGGCAAVPVVLTEPLRADALAGVPVRGGRRDRPPTPEYPGQ
ncbi:hypothetical protein AB0A95_15790 [Micromonospora sp. NPDC049230]|uniref:hypothetical protein n=1 Tax=Micromonospora sp. NPDC049230 TaxID=3155502 RepID=UPI003408AB0D